MDAATGTDGSGGPAAEARLRPVYAGPPVRLARLAVVGNGLTILTLGVWRFWYLTRLRRFHWSAIRVGGEALEYTGRGVELLLGFLIAAVALGLLLGLANLALVFGGVAAGFAPEAAFNAALPVLLPLWFFAGYKARRYRAARTRWRGLRFGMTAGGAWGYALRGTLWVLALIATLGLARPAMQLSLRRYVMDRTFWGDQAFAQGGGWRALMGPWLLLWGVGALGLAATVAVGWESVSAAMEARGGPPPPPTGRPVTTVTLGAATVAAVWLLWQRYEAAAHRVLSGGLTLGGARFSADLRAGRLIRIRLVAGIAYALLLLALGTATAAAFGFEAAGGWLTPETQGVAAATLAVAYALGFVGFGVVREVALVRPLIRAYAGSLTLHRAGALDAARQRPRDPAEEAGGFAEALDVDIGI